MTGLHDPLHYGVVIVMNAALYFCPNEHVFKRLSSLVGYNWRIFKYVFQQMLILFFPLIMENNLKNLQT